MAADPPIYLLCNAQGESSFRYRSPYRRRGEECLLISLRYLQDSRPSHGLKYSRRRTSVILSPPVFVSPSILPHTGFHDISLSTPSRRRVWNLWRACGGVSHPPPEHLSSRRGIVIHEVYPGHSPVPPFLDRKPVSLPRPGMYIFLSCTVASNLLWVRLVCYAIPPRTVLFGRHAGQICSCLSLSTSRVLSICLLLYNLAIFHNS
jgi:hypothetical protein